MAPISSSPIAEKSPNASKDGKDRKVSHRSCYATSDEEEPKESHQSSFLGGSNSKQSKASSSSKGKPKQHFISSSLPERYQERTVVIQQVLENMTNPQGRDKDISEETRRLFWQREMTNEAHERNEANRIALENR